MEEAQSKGTLSVFMFHSVGGGYLNVSEKAYTQLLEYLDLNRDHIWTDTFLNVMRHVSKKQSGKPKSWSMIIPISSMQIIF